MQRFFLTFYTCKSRAHINKAVLSRRFCIWGRRIVWYLVLHNGNEQLWLRWRGTVRQTQCSIVRNSTSLSLSFVYLTHNNMNWSGISMHNVFAYSYFFVCVTVSAHSSYVCCGSRRKFIRWHHAWKSDCTWCDRGRFIVMLRSSKKAQKHIWCGKKKIQFISTTQ